MAKDRGEGHGKYDVGGKFFVPTFTKFYVINTTFCHKDTVTFVIKDTENPGANIHIYFSHISKGA